jgi:hypothetical protein
MHHEGNTPTGRARLVIVTAALACTLAFAVAAQEVVKGPSSLTANASGPAVDALDVAPGDRWEFHVYSDITNTFKSSYVNEVTETADRRIVVRQSTTIADATLPNAPRAFVFDDHWGLIENGVWKRSSPDTTTGIKFPLTVGSNWTANFSVSRKKPEQTNLVTASARVVAWEKVKTKSGVEYDAYRLETVRNVRPATPDTASRPQEFKTVHWYAPKANFFVKMIVERRIDGKLIERLVTHLVSYSRRKA